MSYSPVISFMMDRISGFSTSSFRLQCLGSDKATANQIVRFELPSNALVDVRKFSFAVKLAVAAAANNVARLSEINNIISRVSVTVGGVELQSGFNEYALLKHIKNVLMGESACPVSGHPEFIDRKSDKFSYHTGEAVGALEAVGEYRVENWLGFLGALPTRSSSIPSSARAAAPACRRAEALEVRYRAAAGVGEEAHSRQRHWCPWSKSVNVET